MVEKPVGTLCLRSRRRQDIAALIAAARLARKPQILENAGTDYEFRILLTREEFGNIMLMLAAGLSYSNFKASLKEHWRQVLYSKIWAMLARETPGGNRD